MSLKWINTIAFAAMAAVNALANLLPIGGNTTGQISEAYPNLFTPAPITFAIWGLSPDFWTVVVLLIGAVIASAVVLIGRNRIAGLAVMWAYAGILIRHISAAYYAGSHPFVIAAGFLSEAMILAAILGPQMCKIARNKCCCTKGA